jgi:hypothetical protein
VTQQYHLTHQQPSQEINKATMLFKVVQVQQVQMAFLVIGLMKTRVQTRNSPLVTYQEALQTKHTLV